MDENLAIKMVQWLFKKGCRITHTDSLNQTCMFYVARDGRLKLMRSLIELGVDVNHVDRYG